MKKLFTLAILIPALFSLIACSAAPTPVTPQPTLPPVRLTSRIIAEGKVVPARYASLSFQSPGTVTQIVAVGDKVESGKVVAQLDTKQLELQLAQADANLAAAQAAYDKLTKLDPNELAVAKFDVDKAQAALKQAQAAYDAVGGDSNPNAGMLPQRLALQNAWLDYQKAQTAYASKSSPSEPAVRQAKANVDSARVARDIATDALSRTKIVAPFAGTVVTVDAKVGEQANAGTPVIRLADLTNMQVETTDLTEISVVNVKEGDAAKISFDAIPELELSGKVASIKGLGENRQGDIVYTLVIKLDKQDERLRWNMTAKVTITK